ncbi:MULTISPECIES: sulfur oxidation c-type cytochrome SoxX [unclassified Limnobacter]|uniref:sulfur oxidation c-type cytochrome SoxX n=1 Tax=unclassified Limnobacter TaxID=2630203 RepID=UPI000C3B09EC|nr:MULTISPECIES: sulfur oxidation c-type cytochrome SoxX [unclassified Limnobacter]MAZ08746.1 sulfur oxidation c-type cytochrome SoxX [Sutterellaceae bacterium]|tara:strand:+ start:8229 stop:8870 length:642 start_codon:yes stop_codon:yes gene_type:complete
MLRTIKYSTGLLLVALLAACANTDSKPVVAEPTNEEINQLLLASFKDKGIAKLERVNQTELQKACSLAETAPGGLPDAKRTELQNAALAAVKYPADGKYLGDWKAGEKIAQTGVGFQFSDKEGTAAGGNCYACHQLAPQELSYGNIGPSLYQYGKLRGNSEEIMKYTWAKIWNSHAYNACSNMPRFGAEGILTETQLKDVMALLMAADSPVNK